MVGAYPLKMTALSLRERFYHLYFIDRNVSFTDFHIYSSDESVHALQVRGNDRPSLNYLEESNHENLFLCKIFEGASLAQLNYSFPDHVKDTLSWASEHRNDLVVEWELFASKFYLQYGRPLPEWPAYVDIQESLGIMGASQYHQAARKYKRTAQYKLKLIFDRICEVFPGWKWAAMKRCYLSGALCEKYVLPSGSVSCL